MATVHNNDEREWLESLELICYAFEDFAKGMPMKHGRCWIEKPILLNGGSCWK